MHAGICNNLPGSYCAKSETAAIGKEVSGGGGGGGGGVNGQSADTRCVHVAFSQGFFFFHTNRCGRPPANIFAPSTG